MNDKDLALKTIESLSRLLSKELSGKYGELVITAGLGEPHYERVHKTSRGKWGLRFGSEYVLFYVHCKRLDAWIPLGIRYRDIRPDNSLFYFFTNQGRRLTAQDIVLEVDGKLGGIAAQTWPPGTMHLLS